MRVDVLRPQDPARIGAYDLLARLGAGGMGQVFLGRSPGGRLVAVKVIRDEISDDPETLARFRREAATVETVRSAWTARLIEASLDASPYWLATEYVPGPTLRDAVEAGGPFPPDSAVRLLAALAEGLSAVHAHGVTHRDLKPHNVILSPQGPQLIDFGIARSLGQTALTREGMAPGTPGYAAPEVVLRNEVGPAADVFALGATLAYTVTGRPPFGTGAPAAVSYRAVHEEIDLAGVGPSPAGLIRSCVAKDPAQRPELSAVIAACRVDSALAADPHYRSVASSAGSGEAGAPPVADGRGAGADAATVEHAPAEETGPPVTHGTTPIARAAPERARSGRTARSGVWLAACAVAAAAGVTAWLFPVPHDRDTATPRTGASQGYVPGEGGGGKASGSAPAADASAVRPPDHIVNGFVSHDRWALSDDPEQAAQGIGSCDLASLADASPPMELRTSVSHTSGSDTAKVALMPGGAGKGKQPDPYYVAVGVRPPHETDRVTGRPTRAAAEGIGFTSKPVDLYAKWSSGGTLAFSYPDDFRAHFGGRTVDAIPVGEDRGDWTVVLYHVEGGPADVTSVACNGFHA